MPVNFNPQTVGALTAGASVMLGAFGAHGLKTWLKDDPRKDYYLSVWSTAAQYQAIHGIAMMLVPTITKKAGWTLPAQCFFSGITLFSGSLYSLVLTKIPAFGAIAPGGGLALIAGWLFLAAQTCKEP